jgi:hypothetical protein
MFYGPTSAVQFSYGITQGPYYTHDSIVTLWATLATHYEQKWLKTFEKGVLMMLTSITSYSTNNCSMGQQVVFCYPMVSYRVPTTLMTPYTIWEKKPATNQIATCKMSLSAFPSTKF